MHQTHHTYRKKILQFYTLEEATPRRRNQEEEVQQSKKFQASHTNAPHLCNKTMNVPCIIDSQSESFTTSTDQSHTGDGQTQTPIQAYRHILPFPTIHPPTEGLIILVPEALPTNQIKGQVDTFNALRMELPP